MTVDEFGARLWSAIADHLADAQIYLDVQRSVVVQGRVVIADEIFLSVYFNALTSKTIYALIHRNQRVMGYDNYRFWHLHPFGSPHEHIPCDEPDVKDVVTAVAAAVKIIQSSR
jgi:hypothetical protein